MIRNVDINDVVTTQLGGSDVIKSPYSRNAISNSFHQLTKQQPRQDISLKVIE